MAGGSMVNSLMSWNRRLREKLWEFISGITVSEVWRNVDIVNSLIEHYARGGSALAGLVKRVPTELVEVALAEGEWSARQIILHIVDAEIVGAARLLMTAAQPGSKLPAYAGDISAQKLAYTKQPLEPAVALFQALRRSTTEMLRWVPLAAWAHVGEHEEAGGDHAGVLARFTLRARRGSHGGDCGIVEEATCDDAAMILRFVLGRVGTRCLEGEPTLRRRKKCQASALRSSGTTTHP